MAATAEMRTCGRCERKLPLSSFQLCPNGRNRRRICATCRSRRNGAQKRRAAQLQRAARTREPERFAALREKHAPKKNASASIRRRETKRAVVEYYGGSCACCANTHLSHLTIDHVEGVAPLEHRSPGFYRWLQKEGYPGGFQVLCFNCNAAKYIEGGRCTCQDGGDAL